MFLLRTFGALELTTEDDRPVAGAAAQRKPLLILALAALVPEGIPRERLLRALWPGVDRSRARATLKQHLYALRRATGDPNVVSGTPRLRVRTGAVQVDALIFSEHVTHGRLHDAAALMTGGLLDDVSEPAGELRRLIEEVRSAYASQMALVRQSIAARSATTALVPEVVPLVAAAERELVAAVRRFVRAMITIPPDEIAAYHRVAAASHDLLEALGDGERVGLPDRRVRELLADVEPFWQRSMLVHRMIAGPPGQPGARETVEWLLTGGARTTEPIGRMLERFVLEAGVADRLRQRAHWEMQQVTRQVGSGQADPFRILLLAASSSVEFATLGPLLRRAGAEVVISGNDDETIGLLRHRLVDLGKQLVTGPGDPFLHFDMLRECGPFDLILTGTLLDQLAARPGAWLVERLIDLLTPAGLLCLSSLSNDDPLGPWFRHIARWSLIERDHQDIVLLLGAAAGRVTLTWDHDPTGRSWLVAVRRMSDPGRSGSRVA
ncbi:MAG TPA: hypothetical protein VGM77_13805 [Gemmatimonadales bacterium]